MSGLSSRRAADKWARRGGGDDGSSVHEINLAQKKDNNK